MTPGNELLFLALGGSGEIGMNVNLYGCQGKWVMVDLGLTFADPAYPGVELILPDLSFIEERREDLLGIVLTHGHEDHIGAIPYLAADLGVPLYATPFTAGLIRLKLEEEGLSREVKLHVIENEGSFALGPFGFRYVPLAHSIPEGNAVLIDTPHGRIFHTGDWKLDEKPLLGQPSTPAELTAIGDEGVLALVCDSTNVFNAEASGSEGDVREGLMETITGAKGRVLVTTFASNAARLQTRSGECGRAQAVRSRALAGPDHFDCQGGGLSEGLSADGGLGRCNGFAAQRGDDHCHGRAGRSARGIVEDRVRKPSDQAGHGRSGGLFVQADTGQ
jgi:ribonuclease J